MTLTTNTVLLIYYKHIITTITIPLYKCTLKINVHFKIIMCKLGPKL